MNYIYNMGKDNFLKIENITSYKIFFHTFMYKTKWDMYHIPKNNEQNIIKIEKNK